MPRNPFDNGGDPMVVTANTAGQLAGTMGMFDRRTPVVFVTPDGTEYVSYRVEVKGHGHGDIPGQVMLLNLEPLNPTE